MAAAAIAAAVVLAVSGAARAELCGECRRKAFVESTGECGLCGAPTASGAFLMCPACSANRRQCEACGKKLKGAPAQTGTDSKAGGAEKLDAKGNEVGREKSGKEEEGKKAAGKLSKPGEYVSGDWTYRFEAKRPGTRSEGRYGTLLYKDKELAPAPSVNDFLETPWGRMYWTGPMDDSWGDHGWMPGPNPSPLHKPEGKKLLLENLFGKDSRAADAPPPEGAVLTAGEEQNGKAMELNVGDTINIVLKGNPAAGYDWFRISGKTEALEPAGKAGWSLPEKSGAPIPAEEPAWVVRFKAVKTGSVALAFEYKRPGDRQAAKTYSISVNVRETK